MRGPGASTRPVQSNTRGTVHCGPQEVFNLSKLLNDYYKIDKDIFHYRILAEVSGALRVSGFNGSCQGVLMLPDLRMVPWLDLRDCPEMTVLAKSDGGVYLSINHSGYAAAHSLGEGSQWRKHGGFSLHDVFPDGTVEVEHYLLSNEGYADQRGRWLVEIPPGATLRLSRGRASLALQAPTVVSHRIPWAAK